MKQFANVCGTVLIIAFIAGWIGLVLYSQVIRAEREEQKRIQIKVLQAENELLRNIIKGKSEGE